MDAGDDEAAGQAPVWFLSAEELAATRAKLAKVQARAVKKGFTGSIDLDAVPATRTYQSAGGLSVTEHGFDVTLTGQPPRYAGWRFVATVDAVDGGSILRYPPGAVPTIANDQVTPGECDHCHTVRARRSTVLVLHEDTGEVLQVGRSCLKDFLGHSVVPVFLTVDDVRADLGRGLTRTPTTWDTRSVVAYAWAVVEAVGWIPASASETGRTPTRDLVRLALSGGRGSGQLLGVLAPHLGDARRQAPQIIDALMTGLPGESGYEANLTAVLRGESVDVRHLGLAVSAIPAHQRLLADEATQQARQEAAATVEYVGVVGDKVTLTGTVRTALRVDGFTYHSPDNMMLILDCGTAVAKMVTAASWAYQIKVGNPLTVTGTVKAHAEWNGVNQTVLVRPKNVEPSAGTPLAATVGPHPAVWERVESRHPDGAAAARNNQVRTPTRGQAVSR
jgi:hypothetical protein